MLHDRMLQLQSTVSILNCSDPRVKLQGIAPGIHACIVLHGLWMLPIYLANPSTLSRGNRDAQCLPLSKNPPGSHVGELNIEC
jgi:hypothetical protein